VLDHRLAQQAIEARLRTVVVVTTGAQTLSASATGYARTTGSFLTDGFAPGMEVTPTGFTQTDVGMVIGVTDLALEIEGGRTLQGAGAGRTLSVGIPTLQAWENMAFEPQTGRPFVEGDYVPATTQLLSCPSAGGTVEETGLYVTRWYGLAGTGLLALSRAASALLALFPPGGTLTLANGSALRWRENPGPWRGQARPDLPGWAVVTVTIPWRSYTTN